MCVHHGRGDGLPLNGFSDGAFPTLDSIIDKELLHCVKDTIIIELMIWASVRHTKLTFEEAWFNFVFYIFVSPIIL